MAYASDARLVQAGPEQLTGGKRMSSYCIPRIDDLRHRLHEPSRYLRLSAIHAADRYQYREMAPDILRCFQLETEWDIKKESILALGHLKYRKSLPVLRRTARDTNEHLHVRQWAIWAVGELGTTAEEPSLVRLQETNLHPMLARVVAGALKKVRLDSVRVPKKVIERQLCPPEPDDRRLAPIIKELEEIRLSQDGQPVSREVISLRRKMKEISEEYFSKYMEWIRRIPALEDALTNPKLSY